MLISQMRVLLIDDDHLALELMSENLKGDEYSTLRVTSAVRAWDLLEAEPDRFDVVIVDRVMPGMDGLALLRRIKAHRVLVHIPVIMVTSAADDQDVVEGISAGAFYYLTKPIDPVMLISMVRAAAMDRERYRALQRELQLDAGMLGLLQQAVFHLRTPRQANQLGTFLAKAYPDPERVVTGLGELMVNAVEHGNLEITYEQKTELIRTRRWDAEIERRLACPELGSRIATVSFERQPACVRVTITDQGAGFDPGPFLEIDPARVFDSHGRGIALANLVSFDRLSFEDRGRRVVAELDATAGALDLQS
jgi:DNA-binding response OmpR family regulator